MRHAGEHDLPGGKDQGGHFRRGEAEDEPRELLFIVFGAGYPPHELVEVEPGRYLHGRNHVLNLQGRSGSLAHASTVYIKRA